jgi:hypothetical protein
VAFTAFASTGPEVTEYYGYWLRLWRYMISGIGKSDLEEEKKEELR